jgi:hypothetical protein
MMMFEKGLGFTLKSLNPKHIIRHKIGHHDLHKSP